MKHVSPVQLPFPEFVAATQFIEQAFAENTAALVPGPGSELPTILFFDGERSALDDANREDAEGLAFHLDQFLIFAFGEAPDRVIESWAAEADRDAEDVIAKVKYIREHMPLVNAAWERRAEGLGRSLGRVRESVVYSAKEDQFLALLLIESYNSTTVSNVPLGESRQRLEVTLSKGELAYLVSALSDVLDHMPADDDVDSQDE